MADLWKTIDANYFMLIDNKRLANLDNIVESHRYSIEQKINYCVPSHFSNLVEKLIKPHALNITHDININQGNRNNFIKSSYISVVTYGNLMRMKNKNKDPCDKCIYNFESVMMSKFYLTASKRKTKHGIESFLVREDKNLEKCIQLKSFGFCDSCLKVSTGYYQTSIISEKLKVNTHMFDVVKQRTSQLLNLLVKRCKTEDKVKLAINISLETNLIKEYLFSYLLELEQKLLVDNVFNILGKTKNLLIIEFIRIQGVYIINLHELKLWNKYREASLFKMHKCGFKSYNPYYSFNVS